MRALILMLFLVGCSSLPKETPDENLWLEQVNDPQALEWVKAQNKETEEKVEALPNYKRNEKEIRAILIAKDRIPRIAQLGQYVYNFWQDEKAVRGLWRRTTIAEYKKKSPRWEIVIDVDQLAKNEKENWVWKGYNCLPPEYARCLVYLSRGGKDAKVIREFDTQTKAFVKNGFALPESKGNSEWMDQNNLLVSTDFGPGTMTKSGYPRQTKVWTRGTPLAQAQLIHEGAPDDVSSENYTAFRPEGNKSFVVRSIAYYQDEVFEVTAERTLKKVAKPLDAQYSEWFNGQHILLLRSDWTVRNETFKAGSVVALPQLENAQPKLIFQPNERQAVSAVQSSKNALLINYLDSIQSKVVRAYLKSDKWVTEVLPLPEQGNIGLSASPFLDTVIVNFESFLTPSTVYLAQVGLDKPANAMKLVTLKQLPPRFDSSKFQVEQLWATSKDGTQVPYFLVISKQAKRDGQTPVLVFGYGGFEISYKPHYIAVPGKAWLEKGGAYVIANIRGGGEFGPKWHQAALKTNRQKAFDDFAAVAEDLNARKISKPSKIAITGGSNGGLLVGASFTQRPELFGAVICKVPLLDMLRYNKLLAGASWEGEYGKPEIKEEREALAKYSPYQNVKPGVKYPEVFFITSTADDRVHPGHARKMVARMKAQGHPLLYFENIEGGHSAAANLLQYVKFQSLEYTFLQNRLLRAP